MPVRFEKQPKGFDQGAGFKGKPSPPKPKPIGFIRKGASLKHKMSKGSMGY